MKAIAMVSTKRRYMDKPKQPRLQASGVRITCSSAIFSPTVGLWISEARPAKAHLLLDLKNNLADSDDITSDLSLDVLFYSDARHSPHGHLISPANPARNMAYGLPDWLTGSASPPQPASVRPKSKDGGYVAPDRSAREICYESRDIFFECLDKHDILDAIREDEKARKVCPKEVADYERNCARSWVSLASIYDRSAGQMTRHGR